MALVRYRKLQSHPEGVHRVRDILFDQQVNNGVVEIADPKLVQDLTQRCRTCGSMVDYELVAAAPVTESAPLAVDAKPAKSRAKKV